MTLAELIVKIGADISDYEKKMKTTIRSFQKVSSSLTSIGDTLTVGVSLPLAGIGIAATKMAMNAVESENLFEVSMRGMAGSARVWSEQLRNQLGLNSFELRRNVGLFYTMFQSMGLGTKSAYDMATGLTQLAYDFSSFYNLRPEEAFDKLRSGIMGEVEPLRALGIIVDEATVKAYAYQAGIATQGQELTQQQKVLARYLAIMEQTKTAQGDLARTIDSPTNRLRILKSRLEETATSLGMSLLPTIESLMKAATPFVESLGRMADGFNRMDPGLQQAIVKLAGFLVLIGPLLSGAGRLIGLVSKIGPALAGASAAAAGASGAFAGLGAVIAANPFGALIVLIGVLIAVTVTFWKQIAASGEKIVRVWGIIKLAALDMVTKILDGLHDLVGFLPVVGKKLDELRDKARANYQAELALNAQRDQQERQAAARFEAQKQYEDELRKAYEKRHQQDDTAPGGPPATPPAAEKAITVTDIFTYKLERLERAWELFTLTAKMSEATFAYLSKQQENLQARLQLVTDQLRLTEAVYSKSVNQTGLWSSATMELGKALDDLRIKQAELQKQIEDTTKAMQKQSQFMVKEGTIFANTGQAWVEIGQQGMAGDPYGGRDQAEVDAIARRQGVDVGTAASMFDANQDALKKGDIPKYHSGGIFTAPPGRSEGLALLRDGETVLPTGARAQNVYNINATINVSGARSPQDTAQAVAAEIRRLRQAHS